MTFLYPNRRFTRQVHEVKLAPLFRRLISVTRAEIAVFLAPNQENDLTRPAGAVREKIRARHAHQPERREILPGWHSRSLRNCRLGSRLNLAARLMVKAEWGQILVSEHVAQTPGFVFTHLGKFPYKGFAAPMPTYQLERAKAAYETFFSMPMAGRGQELQRLLAAAEQVLAGHAAAALIYGDPGMGKSRLAFALRETLGERVTWLRGQTDSILHQAFNPFTYILQQSSKPCAPEENHRFESAEACWLYPSKYRGRTTTHNPGCFNCIGRSLYAQLIAPLRYKHTHGSLSCRERHTPAGAGIEMDTG
jgi:hypothetical protein